MRKLLCFLLVLSLLFAFAACAGKDKNTFNENTGTVAGYDQTVQPSGSNSANGTVYDQTAPEEQTSTQSSTSYESRDTEKAELLQSASVDLDADGTNEQVEVLQAEAEDPEQPGAAELEGILRIDGKNGGSDTVFIKKPKGVTGVMNAMEFRDLDGDGIKDVFITIPDAGAAFNLNYFYIYNYANGKSFKFNTDAVLTDFAGGFQFIYKGKGILQARNDAFGFTADFDITSKANGNGPDDEINFEYERAWVEATPVEISENSKISLRALSADTAEIKVPLPVFGLAAADMIGEIDLYYRVGEDFTPVMYRFEVMDFYDDMAMKKIGEWKE